MSNFSYEYLISSSVAGQQAGRHMYFTFTNQDVINYKVNKNNIIFNGPSHTIYSLKVSTVRVICYKVCGETKELGSEMYQYYLSSFG
jgi:riboflavin synthase alpha subunit